MSYEKQTWQTGDVITANKLNHMEDGIAGSVDAFVVNVTATPILNGNGYTFATETAYDDVLAARVAGKTVVYLIIFDGDDYIQYEMSVSVRYSKSSDVILLTLGNGTDLLHTADGIVEDI